MSLSIVTTLVRNLIKVPSAVLRTHVAKDAEVLALRHENAVLRVGAEYYVGAVQPRYRADDNGRQ
ncbi:hypothetical protein [Streptomyces sp. NPDC048527]|uniref:hypothetical protein n=1 Tax=Streptomyces sp. NPDC048527 TaxID=3365568 RepID=UPI00371C4CA4